ncbi:hypothetical protein [Pedobacter cryoconitis]|uniref:Uncharacterized protein n=1 Tax=Pedobacter cryoconitis TaxID=188932 RepID=A0A327SII0_9SPHI|nr:hypothetical protein [Pedobacter cryoconitis]RAJ28859.1 hypothetical protein LY11_03133 [Pedobacter cryoconitis]
MNENTKMGWADKLFAWFSKDVKTTCMVLLTLLCVFLFQENQSLNKQINVITEKGLERVIAEVEKRQDPRFKAMENKLDTIKLTNDSSKRDIQSTTGIVRAVAGKVEKALNLKKR